MSASQTGGAGCEAGNARFPSGNAEIRGRFTIRDFRAMAPSLNGWRPSGIQQAYARMALDRGARHGQNGEIGAMLVSGRG